MSASASVLNQFLEFFLLRRTEARLRARSAEQAAHIVKLVDAANRRRKFIPGFGSLSAAIVSASLLREALVMLLRAHAIERSANLDSFEPATELSLIDANKRGASPGWEHLLPLLGKRDLLAIDETPIEVLQEQGVMLKEATRWLSNDADVRSVDHIRWLRRGRFTALGLVVVLGLGPKVYGAVRTPNVALGKPVAMSSLASRSPGGEALVDGVESGRHPPSSKKADFVVTNAESAPSATIDLGRTYVIHEVRVFNRDAVLAVGQDLRADDIDEGLPYTVELSTDGASYEPLAVRSTHFGSSILDPPWSIDGRKISARFVRVRCQKYLALSEVEVFGK